MFYSTGPMLVAGIEPSNVSVFHPLISKKIGSRHVTWQKIHFNKSARSRHKLLNQNKAGRLTRQAG
jgi:hypothetical protein